MHVCEGTAAYLSAFVEGLSSFLGIGPPSRIDYHYQPAGVEAECYALRPLVGCAFAPEGVVWSERPEHTHEVVHAVLDRHGSSSPFLREGMAVLFSDDYYGPLEQGVEDLDELFQPDTPASRLYHPASNVLNYLLHDFGPKQLMQFYRATPEHATRAEVDEIAADLFGLSLEQVSERAATLKLSEPKFAGCLAAEFDEFDEAENYWQKEIRAACSANAVGPHGIVGETAVRYTGLTIASSAFYQFTVSGNVNRFALSHCELPQGFSYAPQQALVHADSGLSVLVFAELEAGRQLIATKGPIDREFGATVEARRIAPLLQACSPAVDPATVISVGSMVGALSLRKGHDSLALPFSTNTNRIAVAPMGSGRAELCDRDCVCEELVPGEPGRPVEAEQLYWLLSHDSAVDRLTRIAFE